MFEHSVKVPRTYKLSANILQKVLKEGASLKSLLYQEKTKHYRTNVLYALISEAIKHNELLEKLFSNTELLTKEPRLNPYLAKILTVELLFGKKSLPGKSKPEITISSYKEQFESCSELSKEDTKKALPKPRYIRINTNILTTSDAIRAFQDEGYNFIRCTSGSYNDYLEQIQKLAEYDFTQDYHIKTVFVFAPGTKFHDHEFLVDGQILLQDKATALAPFLLAPPPGSVVLDMCAAPGMKTSQVAAIMKNQGKVYSVEMNEERYKLLQEFVDKTKSTCVETINKDILQIRRGEYTDVDHILLDPSCSGSGMDISAFQYKDEGRLAKLTSLQEKLLKHAMYAFPNAKRIVYSTCSLFPEENERVVSNVVTHCKRSKWRVQNVKEILKEQWNNFGSGMYGSIGSRCLYAVPEKDFTTGFFLAILDRDPKDFEKLDEKKSTSNNINGETNSDKRDIAANVQKKKIKTVDKESMETDDKIVNNEEIENIKKKKKKRKHDIGVEKCNNVMEETEQLDNDQTSKSEKKKRKKKKNQDEIVPETEVQNVNNKKKKKKHVEVENINSIISVDQTVESSESHKKKRKKDKYRETDGKTERLDYNNDEPKKKKKKK